MSKLCYLCDRKSDTHLLLLGSRMDLCNVCLGRMHDRTRTQTTEGEGVGATGRMSSVVESPRRPSLADEPRADFTSASR